MAVNSNGIGFWWLFAQATGLFALAMLVVPVLWLALLDKGTRRQSRMSKVVAVLGIYVLAMAVLYGVASRPWYAVIGEIDSKFDLVAEVTDAEIVSDNNVRIVRANSRRPQPTGECTDGILFTGGASATLNRPLTGADMEVLAQSLIGDGYTVLRFGGANIPETVLRRGNIDYWIFASDGTEVLVMRSSVVEGQGEFQVDVNTECASVLDSPEGSVANFNNAG